jgi:hypothetical protein
MSVERPLDLLPDYALGLLDEAEAEAVRAALATDPTAQAELAQLLDAADSLLLAAEPVELPEGALERITVGVAARVAAHEGDGASPPPAAPTPITAARSARRATFGGWQAFALASAAATLALAVGFTVALLAWADVRDERDSLRDELQVRSLELRLSGDQASGVILVESDFSGGVVRIDGLPPAPNGHHYQVWSEGPAGPVAASSFQGTGGQTFVALPPLPRDMTRMFVTVEPDGTTSDSPQGPEVLATGP